MKKHLSLSELEIEVNRLAKKIGARENLLPAFGLSVGNIRPHVEVDSYGYHFINFEQGREAERFSTDDIHILLYHVFRPIVFTLASEHEANHHNEGLDSQKVIFERVLNLLTYISPIWGELELERNFHRM